MANRSKALTWTELRVGVVTIISLVVLAVTIVYVGSGGGSPFSRRYELKALMSDINGLKPGAPVRVGGLEVGSGGKDDEKFRDIYGIERDGGLPRRLAEHGAPPVSVDRVVLTHLHFDHAGGATSWAEDGVTAIPAFPNATYWIHRGEFDDAMRPNARNAASYLERNFAPLAQQGRVRWVGDGERLDGMEDWTEASLEAELRALVEELGLKAGQLFGAIRVAITGRTVAPPLFETLAALGKERSLARIAAARAALAR